MSTVLELLGGIVCAFVGGELFLKGVIGLSDWLRVPKAVTAATLAAFATSSPEISVAVTSAADGRPQIALGDALGSNVVNVGLVLGVVLLLGPIHFVWREYRREYLTALLTPLLLLAMLADGELSRLDAAAMLVVFAGWLLWVLRDAFHQRNRVEATVSGRGALQAAGLGVVGLVALILAGRLIVSGGVAIGEVLGISPFIVGVTVVAFGTSAPELATAVMSKLRGHDEVGIGTVLGSNIFNCLLIVGLAGVVHPIAQPLAAVFPCVLFGLLTVAALAPMSGPVLGRRRGVLLLVLYAGSILAAAWVGGAH